MVSKRFYFVTNISDNQLVESNDSLKKNHYDDNGKKAREKMEVKRTTTSHAAEVFDKKTMYGGTCWVQVNLSYASSGGSKEMREGVKVK